MIADVSMYWMHIENTGSDPQATVSYTVDFDPVFGQPQPNITATIAITAFSQGFVREGQAGAIGAVVTHYRHVNAKGAIEEVEVPHDFVNNAIDIDQCYSVTFALAAVMAWAYAVITIYTRG